MSEACFQEHPSPRMEEDMYVLERILCGQEKPTNLSLSLLQEMTENFSEKRKIGVGGFGEVYKGVIKNMIVAVKRIIVSEITVDDRLFDREVKNLMKDISHRNVVRFIGFCSNTHHVLIKEASSAELVKAQIRERLLCFEYISNGSLDKHITDELRGLEWSIRHEIIKGICHGLHYLHEVNNIVHMDLKPGNIMLDDDMVPKITDFGLSRPDINTHTSGPRFVTRGYCAPEYENSGQISKKADMYSLGVLIIELVTGCKDTPNNHNVLRRWRHRWNKSPKNTLPCQYQQVAKCIQIAAHCRKIEPADRPLLLDIIDILSEAESTNGHTDQISIYSDDDMLGIKPLELRVAFELQNQISSMFKLTNKTKRYYAFNIEAPSLRYRTQPNKGIVSPQSKCSIEIKIQTQETGLQNMPYSDNFIVRSTKVDWDLTAEDMTRDLFNKEVGEVDEVIMTVVVYDPAESKGELKSQDTKKKGKMVVASAFREEKHGISSTRQAEAVPMFARKEHNSIGDKDVRGERTKQPERLTFQSTPRISLNPQSKMSNRAVDLATGAMGCLLPKLRKLLKEEYNLEISAKIQVEAFWEELMDMQLALRKVSEVELDNLDEQVKYWANSVREMSYDIEDVVDDFLVHIEDASDTGFFLGLMQKMFNLFKWGKTHSPLDDAIQSIKKQVQVVADRREKWKIDEALTNVFLRDTTAIDPRIAAIYKDQKELVGIKDPRDELIKWLSGKDHKEDVRKLQLNIVSIVGYGGLGKTTLAKAVYDKIQYQFHPRAFVLVGRNPNVNKVFEEILDKLGCRSITGDLTDTQLINKIRELLEKKRYFVVIDDIWDSSVWSAIKCIFPEDNCGSRVVTTTRIHSVADDCCICSRGYVYEMKPLDGEDSRKLFASRIFGSREAFPNVPEEIATDILKKCGGMPLAIISIASLMAHTQRSRWDSIRNSLMSVFEGNHDDLKDMEKILDLSYMHLSHHLRTCLLDIGKYREGQEIAKYDLLRQWIAQDFVSTTRDDAEDVAEGYFYELINMSMIQPGKIDYNDEILSCRVHDIILDLIRSKAAEENFNLVITEGSEVVTGEYNKVRRVSIHYDGEAGGGIVAATNGSLSHVRSVFVSRWCDVAYSWGLKYVRVLHLEDQRCVSLNITGICRMFLLRYLKVTNVEHLTLPSKIGELRQLETMEVEDVDEPTILPSDIVTLPRLSHLSYYPEGVVLPDGIGRLKSLRTLRGVAFMESSADNIKDLGELTKLRELEIYSVVRIYKEQDELEVNMRIDALTYSIGKLSGSLRSLDMGENCLMLLQDRGWSSTITPPRSLRKLNLDSYIFQRIPEWIAQLHHLYSLNLLVREVANGISIVAGLPSLAYLELWSRYNEREEMAIISGREFGALKELHLDCPYLSLAFQEGALPRLEKLHICFRYLMSAELVPVGIEYLPSDTLRNISLEVHGPQDEQHDVAVGVLLRRSFEPHHPSACITIQGFCSTQPWEVEASDQEDVGDANTNYAGKCLQREPSSSGRR